MANLFISNLSGGINSKTNPLILRDNEFETIINYKLDTIGSLTKRNGYDVFANQPVDDARVVGLFQYTNTSASAETTQVMAANDSGDNNTDIYYNNAGTWTTSKTNDTKQPGTGGADATNFTRVRFRTFLDYLFRVNGVDAIATSKDVNGGTWGTTNAPATITPAFIEIFQDRVYVARNGTAKASRVYFSSLPDTTITWDIANDWFDINPDDGDEITGLENNGTNLLIFKNRAMYRWVFGSAEADKLIGVGTESQECIKTNLDLGITFFANPKGVYAYTGDRPKLISRKIQKWIDAVPATDWNDIVAEVDDDHYYLYLSDSLTVEDADDKGGSRTFTNVMAVYHISLDAWTIYSLHSRWRVANKLIQSSIEGIYFGSHEGRTYQWNSGLEDDSGGDDEDEAVAINAEAISKEYLLNFPLKANFQRLCVVTKNGVNSSCYYQLDKKGDFKILSQLKQRFQITKTVGKECNSMRVKFTDNGNIASRIDGYDIEFNLLTEKKKHGR